jgi:hypothetical protein
MKYRFEITYATKEMQQTCNFLKKMDLDIGQVGIQQIITFTSEKNPSIAILKEHLHQAFKECNLTILQIEGGMME